MAKDDGGPAFPRPYPEGMEVKPSEALEVIARYEGMTLRDWFAGRVLTGIYASSKPLPELEGTSASQVAAAMAYAQADAMLEARKEEVDE